MSAVERTTIDVAEWREVQRAGLRLAETDVRLARKLAVDGRLFLTEERAGLRVKAKSWVGVVRFTEFDVRVTPKLVGGETGLVKLLAFTTGIELLRSYGTDRELPSSGSDLFDLLAWIFADACVRIAAAGPRKDYVEREDELPVLRGRLLADRQLLRRPERPDRLWCRFDEHEHDVPDNQLLAAALRACSVRARHPKVRRRITNLLDLFLAICDPDALDLRTCGEFEYHRLNAHYRDAHGIAWALLDGLGIDDVLATRGVRAFAFLLDMNVLFEQFVEGVVKRMMAGVRCRIHTQHHDGSVLRDGTTGRSYTTVIPDVFIESREPTARSLAIDAKYKLYDDRRIDREDLYQAFVYAHAFGVEDRRLRRTVLMYPANDDTLSQQTIRVHERAGAASAEVHAVGLPVTPILAELNGGPSGYLDRLRGCLW